MNVRTVLVGMGAVLTFQLLLMRPLRAEDALLVQTLQTYRKQPRVMAFLDVIAHAEGTGRHGGAGYYMRYPGRMISSLEAHPATVHTARSRGKKLSSSAAGRYMILYRIWKNVAQKINAKDFSPRNQDRAALYLIWEHGALKDVLNGAIDTAVYKVNRVWSSLPGSPYGQPVANITTLRALYYQQYNHHARLIQQGRSS